MPLKPSCMPGVHHRPVGKLPTRAPKPSGDPRQQPASLHGGASHQHPPWRMTEGQPVCEKVGDAPGDASSNGMVKSLHGVVLLGSHTGTAIGSRSSESTMDRAVNEVQVCGATQTLPQTTGAVNQDRW